jgi:hypothetical protein
MTLRGVTRKQFLTASPGPRYVAAPLGCISRAVVALAVFALALIANETRIDHIELFESNYVTIHFDTLANLNYELQYVNYFPTNGSTWSNLYVAPNLPWPNHYVVADYRTNKARFYRLRVTP